MSTRDCDVTRSGVRVIGDSDGERLLIDGRSVGVGERPLFVSAEDVDGVFVAFAGGDDVAYLVHPIGELERLGLTAGVRNVLVTGRGVYWTEQPELGPCTHYWHRAWDGTRTRDEIPIGGTSQGISYQKPDGTLVWADQEKRYVDGAWAFYLHGSTNTVLAEKAGKVYDCRVVGSFEPRGRQMSDGSAVVAVNRQGVFVETDGLPMFVHTPTIATHHGAVGSFDDAAGNTLIGFSEKATPRTRAIFEMVAAPTLAQSLKRAKERGVALEVYKDGHGLHPNHLPDDEVARGLAYAYASAKRSKAQTIDLLGKTLELFRKAKRPVDLALSFYCQYNRETRTYALTEQQAIEVNAAAVKLGDEYGCNFWAYTKQRFDTIDGKRVLVDGWSFWPNLRRQYQRLIAASDNPNAFPTFARPTPEPAPQPVPQPEPLPEPDMPFFLDDKYTYDQFIELAKRIGVRYREVSGQNQPPEPSDVAHNFWRVLSREQFTEQDMLNHIDPNFT